MPNNDSLIRKYNRGDMTAAQAEAFELRMINEPALARDVELDALMSSAARSTEFPTPLTRSRAWPRYVSAALAASVVGFVVGLISQTSSRGWGDVTFGELGQLRGLTSSPPNSVLAVRSDSLVVLDLPSLPNATVQHVTVSSQNGSEIEIASGAHAGVVSIALAPRTLRPGRYQLWVHDASSKGPSYELEVH